MLYDADYDIDEDAYMLMNTPRNTALTAQRLLNSNQLNELMASELPPLSPRGSLNTHQLLTSLDELASKPRADVLVQSESQSRHLSPRSTGCMISPTATNRRNSFFSNRLHAQQNSKVSNARDSMKLKKNSRSNSRKHRYR